MRKDKLLFLDDGNTVDLDIKVRRGAQSAFVKEGNAVLGLDNLGLGLEVTHIVNVCQIGGQSLAFNGKLGAIEDLERAVLQLSGNLVKLCLRAGSCSLTDSGDLNCVV